MNIEYYNNSTKKYFIKFLKKHNLVNEFKNLYNELVNNFNSIDKKQLKGTKIKSELIYSIRFKKDYRIIILLELDCNNLVLYNIGTRGNIYKNI